MKTSVRPKRLAFGAFSLALLLGAAMSWLRVGQPPEISIEPQLPGIGRSTPIIVRAAEPQRGLSQLRIELVQGPRVALLGERRHRPRPFWSLWGPRVASDEIRVEVGPEALVGLEEGQATIRATADRAGTWLRRPQPVVAELTLPVKLTPPPIRVTSSQTYVAQGGSEAVVYTVGPTSVRDGVRVGANWFPGYPLPGGRSGERFAMFGVPHDFDDPSQIRLAAVDDVGNEMVVGFVDRFLARPLRTDTIRLTESFMARVVPRILAHTPEIEERDDLLESYLVVNRDLRRRNTEALFEIATRSRPEFLWREPFLQLPNTRSMASFADRRAYVYEGREVDQQDHLGFDLASVRQAPVLAANRGVVLLAEYFGIYGNTVILDHGYGLMTLYAHLSDIEVQPDLDVARGARLGRTGDTGLAGGDHLHFSVLLHGLQVNPLEWWDAKWIENRIAGKLGGALGLD